MSLLINAELRKFSALEHMSDEKIERLLEKFPIQNAIAGTVLVSLNSMELQDIYLLSGIVRVTDQDGIEVFIDDRSPLALEPLAKKVPREYDIRAASDVQFLSLPSNLHRYDDFNEFDRVYSLQKMQKLAPKKNKQAPPSNDYAILDAIDADLKNEQLALPTPRDITTNINRYLTSQKINVVDLKNILLLEPTVAVKLINSAKGDNKDIRCNTIEDAITEHGLTAAIDIIKHHNLHDQFIINHPQLKQKIHQYLKQSIYIATISYLLAKKTSNLDADTALLAGLIHNIGYIPLFNYAEHSPIFCHLLDLDQKRQDELAKQIGIKILTAWRYDENIVQVIGSLGDWHRDPYAVADYADIVNLAKLHTLIGSNEFKQMPNIQDLPAAKKVYDGPLNAETSQSLVDEAASKIKTIKEHIKETIDR